MFAIAAPLKPSVDAIVSETVLAILAIVASPKYVPPVPLKPIRITSPS